MSTGSISSVSCFNICILILCLPTTYSYVKILLSDPNFLVTSPQRRSKISYDVIFVHLKMRKNYFFFSKNVLSFRSQKGHDSFFSIFLSHLSNILLSYGLIELARVCTRRTSTLGVDHFKVYDLGIFDSSIRVRNKLLPFKLISVCH